MSTEAITKEEFNNWKDNIVTQTVFNELIQIREGLKEALGNGASLAKDAPSTEYFVGRIQGINEILNIEYEEPSQSYEH